MTELQAEQVVGLLLEIRDLLQQQNDQQVPSQPAPTNSGDGGARTEVRGQ